VLMRDPSGSRGKGHGLLQRKWRNVQRGEERRATVGKGGINLLQDKEASRKNGAEEKERDIGNLSDLVVESKLFIDA